MKIREFLADPSSGMTTVDRISFGPPVAKMAGPVPATTVTSEPYSYPEPQKRGASLKDQIKSLFPAGQ